jgi:hypothetical protein
MKSTLKYLVIILSAISLVSWFWDDDEEKTVTGKREIIVKQYFINDNQFVIICKGWPKEGLAGKPQVDSAKEAALINAQFTCRDLFEKSIDVVRNGDIEEYKVYDDYVTIKYTLKYSGLRKYYKQKSNK